MPTPSSPADSSVSKKGFSLCHWLAVAAMAMGTISCQTNKGGDDPYGDAWGDSDPYGGGYNPYPTNPATSGPGGYPDTSVSPPPQQAYNPQPQPQPQPQPTYDPPASTRSHTVARGDTLWNISQRYGTTVSQIKAANGLDSDLIIIGQNLRIP